MILYIETFYGYGGLVEILFISGSESVTFTHEIGILKFYFD